MDDQFRRARAILNEALSHDIIKSIPDTEEKQIKLADLVVKNAQKAREEGENGDHIKAILFTAEVDWTEGERGNKDEKAYREIISGKIEEGLPIPPEVKIDLPELPVDLTQIKSKQLRFLHGAFNACAARAEWLYSLEEAGEAAAKQIADHYEEEYILSADRKDYGGKAKSAALLKAEARKANSDIIMWRDRENRHSILANRYKRLLEIFSNNCDRLSREGTLREQERQHS